MKRMKRLSLCISVLVAMILFSACEHYERQVVPFKLPSAYPNVVEVADASLAAKAYEDSKEAQAAFGFDIRGAGILPVQVIFDNKGRHPLEIVSDQTFLVDTESNLWPVMDAKLTYDRIARKTELGELAPQAGKMGAIGGAAGAVIGAAIGIVTGHNVAETAAKGAAVGAAIGVAKGGAEALSDPDVRYQIRQDLEHNSLERRAVRPQEVAYGFIFFPGETKKVKELRLKLRAVDTGALYTLDMKL
ncbi:MAG: hypothetical protein PHY31_00830 [Smithellaceae bacterium]|nr:hypothetical protein [Smithellaceae bacterium]